MANIVFRTPKIFDMSIEEVTTMRADSFGYKYQDYELFVTYKPSENGKKKRVTIQEYVGNEFKRCGKNIFDELNGDARNKKEGLRLVRTNTREKIKEIYSEYSCPSCMVSDWEFEHPCEAYATEDFELIAAYWNNVLIARCLCSVKNSARGNVYYIDHYCDCNCSSCDSYDEEGDDAEDGHDVNCAKSISGIQTMFVAVQIAEILRLMGYKKSNSPFVGCKLLNIKTKRGNCIPYIDDYNALSIQVVDNDFLLISNEDEDGFPTDSTDGYLDY